MTYEITRHAELRKKNRSIPPITIDLLERFGARKQSGSNTEVIFFDKRSRKKLEAWMGSAKFKNLEKITSAYLVVSSEDQVVTVGYRTKRRKEI